MTCPLDLAIKWLDGTENSKKKKKKKKRRIRKEEQSNRCRFCRSSDWFHSWTKKEGIAGQKG
jgi:hypothetical protein